MFISTVLLLCWPFDMCKMSFSVDYTETFAGRRRKQSRCIRASVCGTRYTVAARMSTPFSIFFAQSLSIFANFFASTGICLAISPPMNTDSRLVHNSCTFTHSSRLSVALLSSFSLFCSS